ncbi:MAG: 3-deoxy-D-manno-octulosonic acid transferase [Bauldia litoralis]
MLLPIYRSLSRLLTPVARRHLRNRVRAGKEDPGRLGERMGIAGRPRPEGPLIWIHAASVGESLSVLPLIDRLRQGSGAPRILVTSGTVTSAELMAERLPEGAFHQYVPVDCLPWVERFLDHWQPDLALWLESELWPNLIASTSQRGTPIVLVNARLSEKSFRNWRRAPVSIGAIMACFDLVLAQNEIYAKRFRTLGARRIEVPGNLKYASSPLPFDQAALEATAARFTADPMWLAASTHPGEEEIIADAHKAAAADIPGLITVIVPRHPRRGDDIADLMRRKGLAAIQRSKEEPGATEETEIYIADTLGELGLFYRHVEIAFVGGSLVPKGGQNPIEPALLDCAILFGPHTENFTDVYADMARAGAAQKVASGAELAVAVAELLATSHRRETMIRAARTVAEDQRAVINRVVEHLDPFLIAFVGTRDRELGGHADA